MKIIDAEKINFKSLNDLIRKTKDNIIIENCEGQRFIADGTSDKNVTVKGVPGNALGAYLNGSRITVEGNAQDAVGDTMNDGVIVVKGSVGDAVGYAMRGGRILVKGNAGYRVGIHMKEYGGKKPVIVVGGRVGSFLGEYQAGGLIIVLGLDGGKVVGDFCGTGMHGGEIFLRTDSLPEDLPEQVKAVVATEEDKERIKSYVSEFCSLFGEDESKILSSEFFLLKPNSQNPYRQLYVQN